MTSIERLKIRLTLLYSNECDKARENPKDARKAGITEGLDMALKLLENELDS
jgi:hypothetical protein